MNDRMRCPLPVTAIDPESLEELSLAGEKLLERVAQQRFSKSTGAREEEKFIHTGAETIVDLLCFINVPAISIANVGEIR